MKIFCFLIGIYTTTETNNDIQLCKEIDICEKHLIEHFSDEKYELLNKFKKEIFDDNCVLESFHIDVGKILLEIPGSCENCLKSFSNVKIIKGKCICSNSPQSSDGNCECTINAIKFVEFYKLFIRKFILNKFSEGTIPYFFEKFTPNIAAIDILFRTMNTDYDYDTVKTLSEVISKSTDTKNVYLTREIMFLSAFTKYHLAFQNEDSMSLFNKLFENNANLHRDFILYIVSRLDFDFYKSITSKDLFNLVKVLSNRSLNLSSQEYEAIAANIFAKSRSMDLFLEKEHLYQLIDMFVGDAEHLEYLYHFIRKIVYLEMLTEEKKISTLMKMFKIKTLNQFKHLRAFKNDSYNNLQNEESNSDTKVDLKSFYNQFVEKFENNRLRFTNVHFTYRRIYEILLSDHGEISSNGLVKIACIISTLLTPEINQPVVFKDLLKMFFAAVKFDKFSKENILDLIDLHLMYKVSFNCIEPTIKRAFASIETGNELDEIFDHVFASRNRIYMLGVFVEIYDSKKLSESRLNKLIDFLINCPIELTEEFFKPITKRGLLGISFMRKYIQRMINHTNTTREKIIPF